MRRQWRCFHCDAVFRSEHAAGIHFGGDMAGTCACVLPHEQHLVEHIRDLESQLASYRDDRDQVLRSIMTLEGEHRQALQREEEKGYERGMRDAHLVAVPLIESDCPGHIASQSDPKICGRCGVHVDSLRPDDEP